MRQVKPLSRIIATLQFLLLMTLCASAAFGQTLKEVAKFDLPGPTGKRFDYLTVDTEDHYLLSAHLGADQTYVIDLQTDKVVATVEDTPGAEGVDTFPSSRSSTRRMPTTTPSELSI